MTIEEEIRRRLLAHGIPEARLEECVSHIKSDPLMRAVKDRWEVTGYCEHFALSVWHCANSSAMDWLALEITAPFQQAEKTPLQEIRSGEV